MGDEADYVEQIADDVLKVLTERRFFDLLDDQLCPTDTAKPRAECTGSYEITTSVLSTLGFDSDDVADIISALGARGAHCDCEILFNVAVSSRLKAEYWTARAEEITRQPHT